MSYDRGDVYLNTNRTGAHTQRHCHPRNNRLRPERSPATGHRHSHRGNSDRADHGICSHSDADAGSHADGNTCANRHARTN